MWAIAVQFLTGNCVATETSDREVAEWPPHPMRLFMALSAAYFEASNSNTDHRGALEWLESQPAPDILASGAEHRTTVTAFVPVNDSKGADSLQRVRSRQPRTFPTAIPASQTLYYIWENNIPPEHESSLLGILRNVSRIGHSSSLVWSWLESNFEQPTGQSTIELEYWEADDQHQIGTKAMRRFFSGAVRQLESCFNKSNIDRYDLLTKQASSAKGKAKRDLQDSIKNEFVGHEPTSRRPEFRLASHYRKKQTSSTAISSVFDQEILVLAHHDGPMLGSESTLQVTRALRGTIFKQFSRPSEIPEWLSGHTQSGTATSKPHLAIVPLTYVGGQHADGHLLGLGLVFPREVTLKQRNSGLAKLLVNQETGNDEFVKLKLGTLGVVSFAVEKRPAPPQALVAASWTKPSTRWTSVTPVVLDRFPKKDRDTDRTAWLDEVAEIIEIACHRIGLPSPSDVAINHNAFLRGVPRAKPSGGGFPAFENRSGNSNRYMVHVALAFEEPVIGPVILGAGRYMGYGLCKPFHPNSEVQNG